MSYADIFTSELESKKRAGAHLYDVREPDEYVQGHIPGAVNIPLSQLPTRLTEIKTPAVLICLSGGRSAQAAGFLAASGKTDLMNLSGGTMSWMREGRALEQ